MMIALFCCCSVRCDRTKGVVDGLAEVTGEWYSTVQ